MSDSIEQAKERVKNYHVLKKSKFLTSKSDGSILIWKLGKNKRYIDMYDPQTTSGEYLSGGDIFYTWEIDPGTLVLLKIDNLHKLYESFSHLLQLPETDDDAVWYGQELKFSYTNDSSLFTTSPIVEIESRYILDHDVDPFNDNERAISGYTTVAGFKEIVNWFENNQTEINSEIASVLV